MADRGELPIVESIKVNPAQEDKLPELEPDSEEKLDNCDKKLIPSAVNASTLGYTPTPSPVDGVSEISNDQMQRRWLGRKRDSEWVFKPLKLKFKVKELEELYRSYVYRQQQNLLFIACVIMVLLSGIIFLTFFSNTKVLASYMYVPYWGRGVQYSALHTCTLL